MTFYKGPWKIGMSKSEMQFSTEKQGRLYWCWPFMMHTGCIPSKWEPLALGFFQVLWKSAIEFGPRISGRKGWIELMRRSEITLRSWSWTIFSRIFGNLNSNRPTLFKWQTNYHTQLHSFLILANLVCLKHGFWLLFLFQDPFGVDNTWSDCVYG